ncbi:DUF411 domain-containing protein [Crocosphaera sp. XPORK-15E]|uniref:DUF411 domain-containing protein n=1 Tax=Crocosphaera sp. XPORK-15E TaxID=3110247 RepID=UPI002B205F42|nr:DUF411 domain-containing protein [Crocosphaera sp. XPORK-15E]MEA5536704.1 DUF411 domain-containing protein [Crocosphaera sp. XPORK-15E]
MFKSFSKLMLPIILGIAIAGVIGTAYLTQGTGEKEIANYQPKSIILASNWDRINESYNGNKEMTVYRSPSCGCCGIWVEHAEKHGFKIKDIKTDDMASIKQKYQITSDLESCHTAIIDGYVMEGHIPADDIKRFLKEKPNMIGLSVPGMPLGTPGMEAGDKKQPFAVFAFNKTGEVEVFQEHQTY